MWAAFVLCFLGNEILKLENSLLWVSQPLGPIHGCPPWVTTEVSNGLLVPPWEEGKWPGKLSGGQKPNAHGRALDDKWKKKWREEQSGHKQKLELFEKWTLFRSLQSHPFTKPGRDTVLSLGDSQAWPSCIIAKLFVVFICQDLLIEL